MKSEQEGNNKPEFIYIASAKDIDPIEGLENATFYTLDFKDKEVVEDSETFTMEFDGEIPEDAMRAIMEVDPVIVKGGKFYDKDMNLLYDGEGIKDVKIKEE